MDQNIVYYNNMGESSKVTREMISKFFPALSRKLSSDNFCFFVSESRVPNERELYGVFFESLLESCGNDISHVATEFQVQRASDDVELEDSKGRVDFLFTFRSVSYLVEFKVGRINASNEDNDPKLNSRKIWNKAISQLKVLKTDSVKGLLQRKTIKLPIVLYFIESKKSMPDFYENNKAEKIYKNISEFISQDENGEETQSLEPEFELYSLMGKNPVFTRFRKTDLREGADTHLYGFCIFAKQLPDD